MSQNKLHSGLARRFYAYVYNLKSKAKGLYEKPKKSFVSPTNRFFEKL